MPPRREEVMYLIRLLSLHRKWCPQINDYMEIFAPFSSTHAPLPVASGGGCEAYTVTLGNFLKMKHGH